MINVTEKLKVVNLLRDNNSASLRQKLFEYYAFMAEALEDEDKMDVVRANDITCRVLCDKDMISILKMLADTKECREACRNNANLLNFFTGKRLAVELNRIAGECSFDTTESVTVQDFEEAMRSFDSSLSLEQSLEEILESMEADYEEGTEEYSDEERALRDIILNDSDLAQSFSDGNKVPDIEYDEDLLESMKASSKNTAIIEEDTNEYEKEEEDVELTSSEMDEIVDTIQAIVSRNEAVFRSCLELDRPYGLLYSRGLARCEIKDGKLKYIAGMGKDGKSAFEVLYNKITSRYGNILVCANDLRNTPTSENIEKYPFTYYPGYVFQYAFGCVSNKTFRNWNTFSKALREEVTKRLKILFKKGLFYDYKDKIEAAFTNALLIIDYERGAGMKLRMSLAGTPIDCNAMIRDIKSIPTYANAAVNVRPVGGMVDVVDIQIIMDEKQFLSRPSWAYKAMEVRINSGEPLDLLSGIPIGRKVDGEIVNFTFDPSTDFVTLICAGSGAGKGVLTLSLCGAALGNNIPVFYIDFKPDMAATFWEIEEQLGIHTFTFDGLTSKPRKDENGQLWAPGHNIPESLKPILKPYAGALLYVKVLVYMCAIAQYRADNGYEGNLLFVFDEIQAAQKVIKAMMITVYTEMKIRKPKGKEEPSEEFLYLKSIADFMKNADIALTTYLNTTGRFSGVFTIFIGQSPNWDTWSGLAIPASGDYIKLELFGQITKAATVKKLIGKGAGSSKYGLSSLAKTDPTARRYVEENRFFGMYYGNTCDGVEVTVFKPFLTLNSDDIKHKCWTNGIGRSFGYNGDDPVSFEKYRANVAAVHPGDNKYGVHKGTGFLGLTGMYCNQDMHKIKDSLEAGYKYSIQFMNWTSLNSRYSTVEEFLYDYSEMLTTSNIINYSAYREKQAEIELDSENSSEEEILTNIRYTGGYTKPGVSATSNYSGLDNDFEDGDGDNDILDFGLDIRKPKKLHSLNEDETLLKELHSGMTSYGDGLDYEEDYGDGYDDTTEYNDFDYSDEYQDLDELMDDGLGDSSLTQKEHRPVCIPTQESDINYADKLGKTIKANTDKLKAENVQKLNRDNSIDCTRCHGGLKNWYDSILVRTPRGQDKMSALLWKDILDTIERAGFKGATVTRLSIYGNQMYVNGKIVNLNGVLGGVHNVRLQDIVQIGPTMRRFRYLREIRIDVDILDSIQLELGPKAIEEIFNREKNLIYLLIASKDGYEKYTRQDIEEMKQSIKMAKLEQKMKERQARMQFDAECKAKSVEQRGKRGVGYDLSMNKYAKKSFGNAGEYLFRASKPSLVKGVVWGGIGIAAGAIAIVGGLLGGGVRAIRELTNLK